MRTLGAIGLAVVAASSFSGCLDGFDASGNVFGPLDNAGASGPGQLGYEVKVTPAKGPVPLATAFALDTWGLGKDGKDLKWSIDFGDRTPLAEGKGADAIVAHVYRGAGTFNVVVRFNDDGTLQKTSLTIVALPAVKSLDGGADGGKAAATGTPAPTYHAGPPAPPPPPPPSSASSSSSSQTSTAPPTPGEDCKPRRHCASSSSTTSTQTSSSGTTTAANATGTSSSPTPSPAPSESPTPTSSSSGSESPSPTTSEGPTPSPTESPTPTPTASPSPSPTETSSPSPSESSTSSPTDDPGA